MYESRFLSDSELVYNMTNSRQLAVNLELCNEEMIDLERMFESLTPGRRKVAVAAVELYKRMQTKKNNVKSVKSSSDIYNIMAPLVADLPNEEFWVLGLSSSMKLLNKTRLSVGGINLTCVDIRLTIRELLLSRSVTFAVVHNHPSGACRPSPEDINLTERLKNAGKTMDIKLLDHVIITNGKFYSFSDEGLI